MATTSLGIAVNTQQLDAASIALERFTTAARNAQAAATINVNVSGGAASQPAGAGSTVSYPPGSSVVPPAQPVVPPPVAPPPVQPPAPPPPPRTPPTVGGQPVPSPVHPMAGQMTQGVVPSNMIAGLDQWTNAQKGMRGQVELSTQALASMQFQFQDMAVQLASGQSPFMVILQQGSQMVQMLDPAKGVGQNLKAIGASILTFLRNPLNLTLLAVAAVTAGIGYLWATWGSGADKMKEDLEEINKQLSDMREGYRTSPGESTAFVRQEGEMGRLRAQTALEEAAYTYDPTVRWYEIFANRTAGIPRVPQGVGMTGQIGEEFVNTMRRAQEDHINLNITTAEFGQIAEEAYQKAAKASREAGVDFDGIRDFMEDSFRLAIDLRIAFEKLFDTGVRPQLTNEEIISREHQLRVQSINARTDAERIELERQREILQIERERGVGPRDAVENMRVENAGLEEHLRFLRQINDEQDQLTRARQNELETAQLGLLLVGQSVAETVFLRSLQQQGQAMREREERNRVNEGQEMVDMITEQAMAQAKLAEETARYSLLVEQAFATVTAGMTAVDAKVAAGIRPIFGSDFEAQMEGEEANAIRRNHYLQEFSDILRDLPTNKWSEALEFEKALNAEVEKGTYTFEMAARIREEFWKKQDFGAIDDIADAFDSAAQSVVLSGGTIEDAFRGLAKDLASIAWEELITNPMRQAFRSVLNGIPGMGMGNTGKMPDIPAVDVAAMTVHAASVTVTGAVVPGGGAPATGPYVPGTASPSGPGWTGAGTSGNALLDEIARVEGTSETGYNTTLAHGAYAPGGVEPNLTGGTINEAIAVGRYILNNPDNPHPAGPVGRYQFVPSTLANWRDRLGLTGEELFDPGMQDYIAMENARTTMRASGVGTPGYPGTGMYGQWRGLADQGVSAAEVQRLYDVSMGLNTSPGGRAAGPTRSGMVLSTPSPAQAVAEHARVAAANVEQLATASEHLEAATGAAAPQVNTLGQQIASWFGGGAAPTPGLSQEALTAMGSSFGGLWAEGGHLGAGKWGIAGEAGPEVIHGPSDITPLSRLRGGGEGGAVSVSNVFIDQTQRGVAVEPRASRDSNGSLQMEYVLRDFEQDMAAKYNLRQPTKPWSRAA